MPTVPASAYQTTWTFNLAQNDTNQDIAEFSLWFAPINGAEYGQAEIEKIVPRAYSAWTDNVIASDYANNVLLAKTTTRVFLPNGHTLAEAVYTQDAYWRGTGPDPALPWETSLAVSLYTYVRGGFVPNGRRRRGRYYLPPMSANQLESANSGFFKNADVDAELAAQHNFLKEAEESIDTSQVGSLSVFSRMDSVLRPVTNLYLDAKFDSQRRRENRELAGVASLPY